MDVELEHDERLDDLMYKGLRIIQKPAGVCFGMDAVLLANFVHMRNATHMLDLCSGTGIIALLLAGKYERACVDALEIQPEMANMAQRSIQLNSLQDRVKMLQGDLRHYKKLLPHGYYDVITCNPPYSRISQGTQSIDSSRQLSRHESACTLADVIHASSYALKYTGKLMMILRAERVADLICEMRAGQIEPKRIRTVAPRANAPANLVLLEGVRGGHSSLKWESPLIVYGEDGQYTPQMREIYHMDEVL